MSPRFCGANPKGLASLLLTRAATNQPFLPCLRDCAYSLPSPVRQSAQCHILRSAARSSHVSTAEANDAAQAVGRPRQHDYAKPMAEIRHALVNALPSSGRASPPRVAPHHLKLAATRVWCRAFRALPHLPINPWPTRISRAPQRLPCAPRVPSLSTRRSGRLSRLSLSSKRASRPPTRPLLRAHLQRTPTLKVDT